MNYSASELGLDFEEIDEDFANYRGLPVHCYSDPNFFEFEMDAIFEGTWQFLCPVHKVANTGDVFTGRVGRNNVFVVRNKSGQLKGYMNYCRHRGYQLMESDSKGLKLLRCRYHTWAYDLEGNLVAAPGMQDQEGFQKCDSGLIQISVEEWGPLVMVNTDVNAAPLHEVHPQIKDWQEKYGINPDPDAYEEYVEKTIQQESNWKLWYDNGTECYHCPTIHSGSFGDAFDVRDGSFSYKLEGKMMTYSFESRDQLVGDELRSLSYASYQIYPGVQLIQQDDLMVIGRMLPTGPGSCEVTVYYLKQKGSDNARVDQWIDVWHETFEEDGAVAEVQQRNMTSRHAKVFQFVAAREEPTIFINQITLKSYKDYLNERSA